MLFSLHLESITTPLHLFQLSMKTAKIIVPICQSRPFCCLIIFGFPPNSCCLMLLNLSNNLYAFQQSFLIIQCLSDPLTIGYHMDQPLDPLFCPTISYPSSTSHPVSVPSYLTNFTKGLHKCEKNNNPHFIKISHLAHLAHVASLTFMAHFYSMDLDSPYHLDCLDNLHHFDP